MTNPNTIIQELGARVKELEGECERMRPLFDNAMPKRIHIVEHYYANTFRSDTTDMVVNSDETFTILESEINTILRVPTRGRRTTVYFGGESNE
jgi:hypothetical protein